PRISIPDGLATRFEISTSHRRRTPRSTPANQQRKKSLLSAKPACQAPNMLVRSCTRAADNNSRVLKVPSFFSDPESVPRAETTHQPGEQDRAARAGLQVGVLCKNHP